jgi:hypothetical protein
MGQLIGLSIAGPYIGLIKGAVVCSIAIALRLYSMKSGIMHAKFPKCMAIFDASHMFSVIHFGPFKQLKCPSCGKVSLMNSYVKDSLTWPSKEEKLFQQIETSFTIEELEQKRIEDSKYEHA